jgi:hypothetical protein
MEKRIRQRPEGSEKLQSIWVILTKFIKDSLWIVCVYKYTDYNNCLKNFYDHNYLMYWCKTRT